MIGGWGVGLLGLSSKYRPHEPHETEKLIQSVLEATPSYVDTATVYRSGEHPVNRILGSCLTRSGSKTAVVNKVGADLTTGEDLGRRAVAEFEQGLMDIGRTDIVLVHKAGDPYLERDSLLHEAVRRCRDAPRFGICTNSEAVLRLYSARMQIDVLQVAVNLLDYTAARPLLQKPAAGGPDVMARSVLSSGLLGGTYGAGDLEQFSDEIRVRYRTSERGRQIYGRRMAKVGLIHSYFRQLTLRGRFLGSFASFCYLAIRYAPGIDSVIVGGSTQAQLSENVALKDQCLDPGIVEDIYSKRIEEWSAPCL